MKRTRKEWYDYCMKRGTSGDMVFDILKDWYDSEYHLRNKLYDITDIIDYNIDGETHESIDYKDIFGE